MWKMLELFDRLFCLQLIDDLRRELEYLQLFKLEMEHPGKGKGLSEFNAKTREMEMEHEVKRLKQVHTEHTHPCSSSLQKRLSLLLLIPQWSDLCHFIYFYLIHTKNKFLKHAYIQTRSCLSPVNVYWEVAY